MHWLIDVAFARAMETRVSELMQATLNNILNKVMPKKLVGLCIPTEIVCKLSMLTPIKYNYIF